MVKERINTLAKQALAAYVISPLGLVIPLLAFFGLLFGLGVYVELRSFGYRGPNMAAGAILFGLIGTLVWLFLFLILLPHFI